MSYEGISHDFDWQAASAELKLLKALSDQSDDVIYAKDLAGRLRFANPATLALLGKSREEVLGKTDAEFVADPEAARQIMENDRRIMESGVASELEERLPRADGEWRIWHSRKWPFFAADGRVLGLLGISRDVTERKHAENALRDSEEQVRAIFESLAEGVVLLDARGQVLRMNAAVARVLARTLDDLNDPANAPRRHMRYPDGSPIPEEDMPALVALRTGDAVRNFEMALPLADGSLRWLSANAQPLRNGQGEITGAVGSFFDISERKRFEERLVENDRRKNEFLAVLSHELRNPLLPIRNGVYILHQSPPGSERSLRALEVIDRQVGQLSHLVDDLLDVTRISRGKVVLRREHLTLNEVVRHAGEDIGPLLAEAGIEFHMRIPQAPIVTFADRTRVLQIIGNLLQNVLKFTNRGGQAALELAREDGFAAISVEDSGVGIDPGFLETLFEPFVQAAQTVERSRGGLGLGLALVKGIAELHGGSASAASAGLGHGARFTVRLPMEA